MINYLNNNSSIENYLSVSGLNNYIKALFDNTLTLHNIYLRGEVSNCNGINRSGHLYFSLKDEQCLIKAVIFKYDIDSLDFIPKDGDDIIVLGNVSVYPANGTYQIIIKKVFLFGKGDILLKKELLKKKLDKEGLFSPLHKKPIPKYPNKIAIITGKNSAACADIIANIKRRFPIVDIDIFYSLVQGTSASLDIIKTIEKVEKTNPSLLILARGGGSVEDLSAFDDENLVRRLFKCKIPTISAIGHQINLSLCDLVCDKYASTPTGAAEFAVPNKDDIIFDLEQTKQLISSNISSKISSIQAKIYSIKSSKFIKNVELIYEDRKNFILNNKTKITNLMLNRLKEDNLSINAYKQLLETLNPKNILNKGYSIIYDSDGKLINSVNNLKINQDIKIQFNEGYAKAKITSKEGK
ncbi:MAG: exodeoxyribonuclease VII large subunit [Bacilli bacterium]